MTAEATTEELPKVHPPAIVTTGQARRARRLAHLELACRHDRSVRRLRHRLAVEFADRPEVATDTAATINYHLDRIEHHLDMAGAH
jgi:hypothetical protein